MVPRDGRKNGMGKGGVGRQGTRSVEAGGGSAALSHMETGEGTWRVGVRLLGQPGEKENGSG
jgi:hypothetical protein